MPSGNETRSNDLFPGGAVRASAAGRRAGLRPAARCRPRGRTSAAATRWHVAGAAAAIGRGGRQRPASGGATGWATSAGTFKYRRHAAQAGHDRGQQGPRSLRQASAARRIAGSRRRTAAWPMSWSSLRTKVSPSTGRGRRSRQGASCSTTRIAASSPRGGHDARSKSW